MSELTFFVDGEPIPKGRVRVSRWGTYTPKRTQAYEAHVRAECELAAGEAQWPATTDSVEVEIIVHQTKRKGDLDNVAKSLLDGMNGIAFADDVQVESLIVRRLIVPADPGAWVAVRPYGRQDASGTLPSSDRPPCADQD